MREILFRGKGNTNRSDGEWHYGVPILYEPTSRSYISQWQIYTICTKDKEKIPVISDTIGQYTGLTDRNGTKIFEGDILRKPYHPNHDVCVEYYDGSFRFKPLHNQGSIAVKGEYLSTCVCQSNVSNLKVIGNIYDNPELLEVE